MANGKLLTVKGLSKNEIAYNPAVILQGKQKVIAVRVESKDSDWQGSNYDPHIMFYRREGSQLVLLPKTPIFIRHEDPWATWINSPFGPPELLFGAVCPDLSTSPPTVTTRIYLAPSVEQLDPYRPYLEVRGMKDIRICQLPEGKLAVFTRPTINHMFFGRIGFAIINSLPELPEAVKDAQLLNLNIDSSSIVGTNEVSFSSGQVQVFCHVATKSLDEAMHYSAYKFLVDPNNPFSQQIPLQQVCARADFPSCPAKTKFVEDVVFPGGTGGLRETDFYCGLSDAAIGVISLAT